MARTVKELSLQEFWELARHDGKIMVLTARPPACFKKNINLRGLVFQQ
jgi:hypothetical protein